MCVTLATIVYKYFNISFVSLVVIIFVVNFIISTQYSKLQLIVFNTNNHNNYKK